jgi:hypothetical protein
LEYFRTRKRPGGGRRPGAYPPRTLKEFLAASHFPGGGDVLLQEGEDLGRDGFAMLAGAISESLVQIVRNVFDVEGGHRRLQGIV